MGRQVEVMVSGYSKVASTLAVEEFGSFPEAEAGQWFVLHTKSRQEKALSDDLEAMGIAHFLPAMDQPRFYGNRKAIVRTPLFPGYLFLRGSVEQAYTADRTRRIANILRVPDQQRIDWELRNIHLALREGAKFDPYPALQKGVRVEVRSGPFRGLQGMIEDRLANDRLILQINTLGRAVSLEIDGALLDPIV